MLRCSIIEDESSRSLACVQSARKYLDCTIAKSAPAAWYTRPTMVRRFLHLLMLVMAFQLSWNVVTDYCMHETGRAANHLGHHQHEATPDELAQADHERPDSAKKAGVHDVHCASCAHLALAAPAFPAVPFGPIDAERTVAGVFAAPDSAYATPPERPQWPRRA